MTLRPWNALRILETWQCAYLAGLIDGEGCITTRSNSNTVVIAPAVTIQMATPEPLTTVGTWLDKPPYFRKDRQYWRMDWQGIRAVQLLTQIRPYLLLKGSQADLAFELAALAPGRGAGNCPRRRHVARTPPERVAQMQEIKAKMTALKKIPDHTSSPG